VSRVLISGYYGFGNAGDEAVLAALLTSLKRQLTEIECEVLSGDPAATTRLHGVPAFHRARPREVVRSIRRSDLFIIGGGSLLQDVTSRRSPFFYLAQIVLARLLGRRVMVYAQGIGPLQRPAARRLTARVLRGVEWITVRDAESAAELRRIGLTCRRPTVEVTADPVFALAPASAEWAKAELLRRQTADGRRQQTLPAGIQPRLGISVREWPQSQTWIGPLGEAIAGVAEEIGFQLIYFPLQGDQDAGICRRLAERTGGLILPGDYTPGEWMALAGRMDLCLGMRLHALIFAAVGGVPLVGLAYDPKVTALLARLREAPALPLANLDTASLRQALEETWNVRDQRSVQIREAARELSTTAEISACRAAALLCRRTVLSSEPSAPQPDRGTAGH
jgi:polysaccharide pyruvyl transferase CsaB